jgi:hypothetical protein
MSTGPGPTIKADGSDEASVDDIADLLVEGESSPGRTEGEQSLDDGLDVMLETPGPALVSTFMPPPPAPPVVGDVAEDADEGESAEEPGEATNLAYEDLLAKLVLPAKSPEPEPAMPSLASSLPLPESILAPAAPTPPALSFKRPSSASFQVAPPSDERTLVTVNPLLAEEQEAAAREGRSREFPPMVVQDEMRPAFTEPMAVANGAKSRLFYLMAGGLLVLGGFVLAVVLLRLIMPAPVAQPPVVISPAPLPSPAPPPPAHVEPLPPSAPPAAPPVAPEATAPAAAPAAEIPAPAAEEATAPEVENAKPRAHRSAAHKVARVAAPKPVVAPKTASAPAPAPAAKAPKATAGKKKASGYADPFDN